MVTDIQQATIADLQEKIAETHELRRLERNERDEERRLLYAKRIGQNLYDFQAALPQGKFITLVQSSLGMSIDVAQDYMGGTRHKMNGNSAIEAYALVKWDRLRQDIIEASSIDELKDIRDKAEAIRLYARKQKHALDIQNNAAEVTLRCSRRMGEMLQEMPKNEGGQAEHKSYQSQRATSSLPKLEDIGITKSDSSRCQSIASIPEETFEQHIVEVKGKHEELTQTGLVQRARRQQKERGREQKRDRNRQEIAQAPTIEAALQTAKFSTIVIDPPWEWEDEGDVDQLGRARPTYKTMSFEELLAFPVGSYADNDCHAYLWITNRSLPKGFRLLETWGFRYITCITWVKPHYGMGNYFRGQTEHILFGIKGSLELKRKDVGTVFNAPRGPNGHSSKPLQAYTLIESCSPGPYLELFARSERPDWTSWGAEV